MVERAQRSPRASIGGRLVVSSSRSIPAASQPAFPSLPGLRAPFGVSTVSTKGRAGRQRPAGAGSPLIVAADAKLTRGADLRLPLLSDVVCRAANASDAAFAGSVGGRPNFGKRVNPRLAHTPHVDIGAVKVSPQLRMTLPN